MPARREDQHGKSAGPERQRERRLALARLVLGCLQMFGAALGVVLLLQQGVTKLSLLIVILTGLCTTLSVLLFGSWRAKA